jgi:dTDP-4-dehydrorhamnose 3,5-epimerase
VKFRETKLAGAFVVEPERVVDERGFFARSYCRREFERLDLESGFVQSSISYNEARGILRGMHYQVAPHEEAKLVRCTRGAIHDVIVDLRPGSTTFNQWVGMELSAENRLTLYVPRGFAHGFVTLEPQTELAYQISAFYEPGSAVGFRWDDPAFGIEWPVAQPIVSERDAAFPDFK